MRREWIAAEARKKKAALRTIDFDATRMNTLLHVPAPTAPPSYLLGWDGTPQEAWRVQLRDQWFRALIWSGHHNDRNLTVYREWAGCHLDLAAVAIAGRCLTDVFFSSVRPIDLPHAWFRWAVDLAQSASKIGSGNAVDNQHSAYLPEADMFVTADRRMAAALAIASKQTPFPTARTVLVPAEPQSSFANRVAELLSAREVPA